jgi:hydrogenase maturation protease
MAKPAPSQTPSLPVGALSRVRVVGLGTRSSRRPGVGRQVTRALATRLRERDAGVVALCEVEQAGLELLEAMAGADTAVLVDAVLSDRLPPGTLVDLDPAALPVTLELRSAHDVDLAELWAFGTRLGFAMPRRVMLFGICVGARPDEPLAPADTVERAVPDLANRIAEELAEVSPARTTKPGRASKNGRAPSRPARRRSPAR